VIVIALAGIAHHNIQPETILIDDGTVRISAFTAATVLGTESQSIAQDLAIDRHMLACTILYTLPGGRGADDQPLNFNELMDATKTGFDDPRLFDHVKAARLELADLLQAMVDPDMPLQELLTRPFYWWPCRASCGSVFASALRLTAAFRWAGRKLERWNILVRRSGT
jgi:hypothetical protein